MFIGGKALQEHLDSRIHKEKIKVASTAKSLNGFIIKKNSALDIKVSLAEAVLAFHTVKHHMSYRSMDCTPQLLRSIFDDSETVNKIGCARTKTEAIINNILSPHSIEMILQEIQSTPFLGLGTDGSNHKNIKLFPIVIQYFDGKKGIQVRLLDFHNVNDEKAETISNYIMERLKIHGLSEKISCFVADNANTNFGGINRGGKNNIFYFLKQKLNSNLIGVGCSSHILHNSVHHGIDQFGIFDVDSVVLKIFNYFSIYTVRTESLKEFCDFAETGFQELLNHSKTRWLSLLPAVERILSIFEGLKSYFLSVKQPPKMILNFFEHDIGECFFWFVHSFMSIFHSHMLQLEREDICIAEMIGIVEKILQILRSRAENNFVPHSVRKILKKLCDEGKSNIYDDFLARVKIIYHSTIEYLEEWSEQYCELKVFRWIDFKLDIELDHDDVQKSAEFLFDKKIVIDDSKLFDQTVNLKNFLAEKKNEDEEFFKQSASSKMCCFFAANVNLESYSELLRIAQFFFSIPAHNANCERVFSLMTSQWTKERNRFTPNNMRHILNVVFNLSDFDCVSFKQYLCKPENLELLRKIGKTDKYDWKNKNDFQ